MRRGRVSKRRRKLVMRGHMCCAVAVPLDGVGGVELTLFVGRRSLTRVLPPPVAAALAQALSRGGQSQ